MATTRGKKFSFSKAVVFLLVVVAAMLGFAVYTLYVSLLTLEKTQLAWGIMVLVFLYPATMIVIRLHYKSLVNQHISGFDSAISQFTKRVKSFDVGDMLSSTPAPPPAKDMLGVMVQNHQERPVTPNFTIAEKNSEVYKL